MSCTTLNRFQKRETNLEGAVQNDHAQQASPRAPPLSPPASPRAQAEDSKRNISEAKKNILARVLTSRRSLFQDARRLFDSQPKMILNARMKMQLGFSLVFLAVHRQNLKRQVCQIFMQAGYERKTREALEAGKPIPFTKGQTSEATAHGGLPCIAEAPKERYSNRLAGTLRQIMEARAWMCRAQERKNELVQKKTMVSKLANKAGELQETLGVKLEAFALMGQNFEDQLAMAQALEAKVRDNADDVVRKIQLKHEQRQLKREMDHEEREACKNAAIASAAKARDALRNSVEEEHNRALEETRLEEEEADLLIRLAEKEQEEAVRAYEAAQKKKEEVSNHLLKGRQGTAAEETTKSSRSDVMGQNFSDHVLGAHGDKGSTGCHSVGPACNDQMSSAVAGGGSRAAAGGILGLARARVAESGLSTTSTSGLANTSSADAGGTVDLVTPAAHSGLNSTNSSGPAIIGTAQTHGNQANNQNSTTFTATDATVSSGSTNPEAKDSGQTITGTLAAVETRAAKGTTAAVGTLATIDCTETIAHHSIASDVAHCPLVDGYAQESVAKVESSKATIHPTPSESNGITGDSTSSCTSPTTADGQRRYPDRSRGDGPHESRHSRPRRGCQDAVDARGPTGTPSLVHSATTDGACAPLQQRPQQTWHKKHQTAGEEASLDGVSTDAGPHPDTTESDSSSSDDVTSGSLVHGGNFGRYVASRSESSSLATDKLPCPSRECETQRITSTDHPEGSSIQESPELKDIRKKAQQSLLNGVDTGSLAALLVKATEAPQRLPKCSWIAGPKSTARMTSEKQRSCTEDVPPVASTDSGPSGPAPATPKSARRRRTSELNELPTGSSKTSHIAERPNHRHLQANAGNLDVPDPLSTTLDSPTGSRVLSKLSHHGVDSLSEIAEGDWPIRTESRNQGIGSPRALELRPNTTGSLVESRCDYLTARPSSMAGRRSQDKGFANTRRGPMEATTLMLAETLKVEEHELPPRTTSKPSSATMTTEESSLANPALGQEHSGTSRADELMSARMMTEVGRGKDLFSSCPAPLQGQDTPMSVRRFGSKAHCDSNAAATTHETLATTLDIGELAAAVQSPQRRRTKGSTYLSFEELPDAVRSLQRRNTKGLSKRATCSATDIQDALRPRRSSKNTVLRDAQAEHGTKSGFPQIECLAVAQGVDIPNHSSHPSQGHLVSSPRRSSKAIVSGPIMPLNIVGQRVVQPEVLGGRTASKTASGATVTPRGQSNHVPKLEDLIVFGGNNEVGAHTERRMRSKANSVALGDVRPSQQRTMTAPQKGFNQHVHQETTSHETLVGAADRQQAVMASLTLNGNRMRSWSNK